MKKRQLIALGLWAANHLGAKPDAQIIFLGRGRRAVVAYRKIRDIEGTLEALFETEHVSLERTPIKEIWVGYSERCNQLFINLGGEGS